VLFHLTMREPRRGAVEGRAAQHIDKQISTLQAIRTLMAIPSYRHLVCGMALLLFGGTGTLAWFPSLVGRSFDLDPDKSGLPIALIIIIAGIIGTLLIGGMLADRLSKTDPRWLPGIAVVGALVMSCGALGVALASSIGWLWLSFFLVAVGASTYVAPSLAISQSLAPIELRATSGALAQMIANLFGLGLGAPVIGIVSDFVEPQLGNGSLAAAMLLVPVMGVWAAFHYGRCAAFLPQPGPTQKENLAT